MIEYRLDRERAIVHVRPLSSLIEEDFTRLAAEVDPFLEERGELAGLILEIETFPGWEDFGAALCHLRFVRDHHKRVKKIAVVTDSRVGWLAEQLASHFVAAEIRRFDAGQTDIAQRWILGEG